MKGWHKHGVCSRVHWVYDRSQEAQDVKLFTLRYEEALRRPLGAYFRVNHKDLIAMHAAISEVGILSATAQVHEGWQNVGTDGVIAWEPDAKIVGGHAFAIVAYDQEGFWIQNSWADDWGNEGFARVTYDDWLANGSDAWVARLGGTDRLTNTRVGITQRRRRVARVTQLCVLRPPPASHQPRQQRCLQDRRDLWHLRRGRQGNLQPDLQAHR
jgi:Papain family cysteine protease